MKKIHKTIFLFVCLALFLLVPAVALAKDQPKKPSFQGALDNIDWEKLQTIPIQDQGRIKPLDTFARILLYQFSGKGSLKTPSGKLSPIQWLFGVLFDGKEAKKQPIFLVENPEVLEDLGLDYKKVRDRYSYEMLKPKMKRILQQARTVREIEDDRRSPFQKQILNLAHNLLSFEGLLTSLNFVKGHKPQYPLLAKKFGSHPSLMEYRTYMINQRKKYFELFQKNLLNLDFQYHSSLTKGRIPEGIKPLFMRAGFPLSPKTTVANLAQQIQKNLHISMIYDPVPGRGYLSISYLQEKTSKPISIYLYPLKGPGADPKRELIGFVQEYSLFALVQNEYSQIFQHLQEEVQNIRMMGLLNIFPPEKKEAKEWAYPWALLMTPSAKNEVQMSCLEDFAYMAKAYQQSDWKTLNSRLQTLEKKLVTLAKSRGEYKKIPLEVKYNQYDLFFYTLIFYLVSMLFCSFSWLGWGEKIAYRASWLFLFVGYGGHTCGMILRMMIKGRPPVSTLYESALFVAWVGVALGIGIEGIFRNRFKSIGLFGGSTMGVILMFVASKFANDGDSMGVLVAVLDSNFWLATHVTTITIGYSACLLAGALGHVFILMQFVLPKEKLFQANKEVSRMLYGAICFATIFSFVGTVLGGLWADQSWGRFWGWDPKENGALLIVLWNAVLIHARLGGHIRQWGLAMGAIFGNIVVAAAWWGVNLLQVGLHSYGFTMGLAFKLMIFASVEMAFIGLGCLMCLFREKPKKPSSSAQY